MPTSTRKKAHLGDVKLIFLKDYNVLFLKPRKVAGTSFEIALSQFANPNDIITPISPDDEETRRRFGFRVAQNYTEPLRNFTVADTFRLFTRGVYPKRFYNHISARESRKRLGSQVFDNAYKITIVRNPFDTLISLYYWEMKNRNNHISFEEYFHCDPKKCNLNNDQYFIDEENIINFYIKYELMHDDILSLEEKLPYLSGLSSNMKNIKAKSGIRTQDKNVNEYFTDDKIVETVKFFNKAIIEKFNYDLS